MSSLFFTCPTTRQQAPTCIETDVQSLRAAWKATLNVKCPHCGEVHEISVRETYINGALKRPISLGHLGGPVRLPHSITSSARARSVGGTVRPSIRVV